MYVWWSLDLVTLLVSQKTVTKSQVVTKSIAHAYWVSINSEFHVSTKVTHIFQVGGACSKLGAQITYDSLKSGCAKSAIHLIVAQKVGAQLHTLAH